MEGQREIGWIAHDIRSYRRHSGSCPRRYSDAPLHPGLAMARHRAEVNEFAGLVGRER
jgi:hypothetical protein